MRRFAPIFLIGLTGAVLLISSARISFFDVEAEGTDFIASWQSEIEQDVVSFELHRKTTTTNDQFVLVESVSAKGDGTLYQVRDDQVFKSASELIEYRLQAVLTNGSRFELGRNAVNYTPTAIRRTWGSIKAMF